MNDKPADVAARIADELAACGVKLVASLPDNWLTGVIDAIDRDERFVHIPVNREESAIGLCAGAYMGAMGSAALIHGAEMSNTPSSLRSASASSARPETKTLASLTGSPVSKRCRKMVRRCSPDSTPTSS